MAVKVLRRLESNNATVKEGEKIVKETVKEVSSVLVWIRCWLSVILLGYR